ncbi:MULTISPECIES: hypothetical protein [unclassified Bacillus (in: firmicutes)]|uniref:hypothetical protein n=1 Tax=unclassified Bacillus (in: firmicutes) TaxID=185979 RepID=UPI0008E85C7D|nr:MULTISPECIES: hypothetical protein [unclassified Bacillus (in: firmicutes)]SFA69439.1 hypothetical protein SAMN02799634_10119 [Bacillus sp. UNCCL13]SFQ58723.1 hypothetical protein SAMN04488577_0302 [Bacillus sp. cl95]
MKKESKSEVKKMSGIFNHMLYFEIFVTYIQSVDGLIDNKRGGTVTKRELKGKEKYFQILDYLVFLIVIFGNVFGIFNEIEGVEKFICITFFVLWGIFAFMRHIQHRKVDAFLAITIVIFTILNLTT